MCPESIGTLRWKAQAEEHVKIIKRQKTNAAKKAKSTEYGIRDINNPLQDLSVDLYRLN